MTQLLPSPVDAATALLETGLRGRLTVGRGEAAGAALLETLQGPVWCVPHASPTYRGLVYMWTVGDGQSALLPVSSSERVPELLARTSRTMARRSVAGVTR